MNPLPDSWEDLAIESFGEIVGGGTPSRATPSFWGGSIPWITPTDITALREKYVRDTPENITDDGLVGSAARLLPPGSIVVTTRATLGEAAIAAVPLTTNQGFKSIVPNDTTDSLFTYYLVKTLRPQMLRLASGTTFPEISKKDFARICVSRPHRLEQCGIAAVLEKADEAIAKTEAVIAKLRQVRAGLLHDLLTRGIDHNGQLRDPIAHPEQFQDTSLGQVPRDWEIHLLDDVTVRGSGHTPAKDVPGYWNGGIKWVSLADSDKLDRIYISETENEISDLGIENSSAVKHPAGTVILSRDAGIGKSAVLTSEMAVSQHFMAWRCGKRLHNIYLYYWLQHNKPRFEAIAMGSTIKTIGLPYFKRLKMAVPRIAEQQTAANALLASEEAISSERLELKKLQQLKSGLMGDLLTGRVRVPAPESTS
jgi:type I restriction enzyme S subunit